MKLSRKVTINNALGLHSRPASKIAKLLQKYSSSVTLLYQKESANARSIMSMLMLTASKNARITIVVEGEDAKETMDALVNAFTNHLGD